MSSWKGQQVSYALFDQNKKKAMHTLTHPKWEVVVTQEDVQNQKKILGIIQDQNLTDINQIIRIPDQFEFSSGASRDHVIAWLGNFYLAWGLDPERLKEESKNRTTIKVDIREPDLVE